jgi:hypothetical protein
MKLPLTMIYPELRAFTPAEREGALRAARHESFDAVELVGMAAALVAVTALTRYGLQDFDLTSRIAAALVNFALAVPLLVAGVGPFLVRRARRGLRAQLARRGAVRS